MNTPAAAALIGGLLAAPACAACWQPAEDAGTLAFQVEQPGDSTISGTFTRFDGNVCLDPADPASARITLEVETASVDTGLPELDAALRGPQFFDSERWPEATFTSETVSSRAQPNHYRVTGAFSLHGISRTIRVPFLFEPAADHDTAILQGNTTIKRLDFDVGQGRWSDTRWADDEVKLEFSVRLRRTKPARPASAGR